MTFVTLDQDELRMPIRPTRPRKSDGLKKYIVKLYQDPLLRFFSHVDEWGPISDLIYGPVGLHTDNFFNEDVRKRGFERLAALKELWGELREDILEAQQQHQPNKKPWGARFDRRTNR